VGKGNPFGLLPRRLYWLMNTSDEKSIAIDTICSRLRIHLELISESTKNRISKP